MREENALETYVRQVKPLDREAVGRAREHWNHVAHPLHSLGLLEDAIVKIAGMTGDAGIHLEKKTVLILCADNGIVEEGVTQTDSSVTASVVCGFTRGEGCVTLMAKQAGADCIPVDLGIADPMEGCGNEYPLVRKKIALGTRNFRKEPAMTEEQVLEAIRIGIDLVRREKEKGTGLIAVGEMGIGNTTTSSALAAVFLGKEAEEVTGKGAGLSRAGLDRKVEVIREAIDRYALRRQSPLRVLQCVGGLDLAGMTGVYFGGAIYRIPILVDGVIAAAGALTAARICPETVSYMLATHVSGEPAGKLILEELGLKPFIDCGMCLGEGTGAVAAMPLLDMAARIYSDMRTFEEYQIEEYKPL
ncbi:MAG: nicotinate-nucleotide--dimethylbenzimidazole phosphoribosyltransferase [Lachnospiraceae bacterium]